MGMMSWMVKSLHGVVVGLMAGTVLLWGSPNLEAASQWQGDESAAWETAGNWKSGNRPDATDDQVWIFPATPSQPVISSGSNVCATISLPPAWVAGDASLTIDGGILNANKIELSSETNNTGTVWINGGTVLLRSGASIELGNSGGDGLLDMSDGSLLCDGDVVVGTNGVLALRGGELSCETLSVADGGLVDIDGGTLRLTMSQASFNRMRARFLIEQGKLVAHGGAGRLKWDSDGADLILTAEMTNHIAQAPVPDDLATEVASGASIDLTWTPGDGATSHNVYFSDDAEDITFHANQTTTNFSSGALQPNSVYYWRVDEVAGGVTNRGDVWSFRTDNPGVTRPTIGVIRWDMYSGEGATQKQELGYLPGEQGYLSPGEWHWRAPFFCRYTNDVPWIDHAANGAFGPLWFNYPYEYSLTRDVTDQEIAFAGTAGAGIDYWIYGTAPASSGGWGLHWNLDALLESERRLEINYAMMYRMDAFDSWSELEVTIDEMVWQAKQPNYQTVLNDRPIFYFIHYDEWSANMGDPVDGSTVTNLATAVQMMRDAITAAGLPDPYLVATAVPAHARKEGNWIDGAGFDAGNDYRGAYGGQPDPGRTFSELGANLEPYWDQNRDDLAAGLIPAAPCGANSLPREPHGLFNYDEPEPGDLAALMNRVMTYIDDNPVECEAKTFTMYAWNEHSEGGFLCPIMNTNGVYDQPDTWRLDEVGAAVNNYLSPDSEPELVMVRADGAVYHSATDGFDPRYSLDLSLGTNAVVAAATEGRYVYGLLDNGEVVRADMLGRSFAAVETLGTFSVSGTLTGIDVKNGHVFVVDTTGRVYKNFSSVEETLLSNTGYLDIAAGSPSTFRGLCDNDSSRTWMRDQDDEFVNFHNSVTGVAIANEAGSGYYAMNASGQVYGPDDKILQNTFGTGFVDLSVTPSNLYCIAADGSVQQAVIGGAESALGTVDAGMSAFVAIDWIAVLPEERGELARQPNVIVILSDDHGFTDLGIYGLDANVRTPCMDELAANGAYMTKGYATAPQCIPSRAGMISGSYGYRYGVRINDDGYLPLTDPYGAAVVTHAEDMKSHGYATGLVGKWHLDNPDAGDPALYTPRNRGFDDYFYGFHKDFEANFDPTNGNPVAIDTVYNHAHGWDGRILIQGQAACTFVENNKEDPFYLYYSPYGPHVPRLSSDYEAVVNFPAVDYPMYDAAEDQVRREGLALIKMIDDSISNIVQTLRDNNLEEDTLILFVSDNGAQPKLWTTIHPSVDGWDGSENVPRRGEKGSLFEGGINVPMWAYWKGVIQPGQRIDEAVISLDFMATAMRLASGAIPERYDGVDILPKLSGQAETIDRPEPMYWNYGSEGEGAVAIRDGDWKLYRGAAGDFLFDLANDPNELTNLVYQLPATADALALELETFIASLPPEAQVARGESNSDFNYVSGPTNLNTVADARYLGGAVYALPIVTPGAPVDSDGDGLSDAEETAVGRNPYHAGDLTFEFDEPGDYRYYSSGTFDGWLPTSLANLESGTGTLKAAVESTSARIVHPKLGFNGSEVPTLEVQMRADTGTQLKFFWATEANNSFESARRILVNYTSNQTENIVLSLAGHAEWDGQIITQLRVQPMNAVGDVEIDFVRSTGTTVPPLAPDEANAVAGIGSVTLDWADNSEADLAGYSVYRSTTPGGGYGLLASGLTTSEYADDSAENHVTYYYVMTASDTNGNESPDSNEVAATPGMTSAVAVSDIAVLGSVSGSVGDSAGNDGIYQSITEAVSGNTSALEHKWVFTTTPAELVTFYVEAHHTANSEGDDFVFAWSTNDVDYTDLLTVSKTADDDTAQYASLPSGLSGMAYIRAVDADRTDSNLQLDTLYVDAMFMVSEESSVPPTMAGAPYPANGATDVPIDVLLDWGGGLMASSYEIYFGGGVAPSYQGNQPLKGFDPGTLQYETTYQWRVDAVNNSGMSTGEVWSFTTAPLLYPVADGDFEQPGSGWSACMSSWNPEYGTGSAYALSGSPGGGGEGDWKAYFANKQNLTRIYQDLDPVMVGDTLNVTCLAMRSAGSNGDIGGVVACNLIVDGIVEQTVHINTTGQPADDSWFGFTNEVTVANAGALRLEFVWLSGEVWIDAISDIKVTRPSVLHVADGGFEQPGSGWSPCMDSWSPVYGTGELYALLGSGDAADGNWKAYIDDKQQAQQIHQDLGPVPAGVTVSVSCAAQVTSSGNGSIPGVLHCIFEIDNVPVATHAIDTSAQPADDQWYTYTNTTHIASGGELTLRFARVSGQFFLDDISDVTVMPTLQDTTPPAAPTALVATPAIGSIALDWVDNAEGDLDDYTVYRSTTSGSGYVELAAGVSSSDYVDVSAVYGTVYYYAVSAFDNENNESVLSAEVSASVLNGAPSFNQDPFSTQDATEDAAYSETIAGKASDPEDDSLTFTKVSGPAWLNVATNGALSGTPLNADAGLNSFTVSVSDGINAAVEADLDITVIAVNDAPIFSVDPVVEADGTEDAPYIGTLDGSATDEEGDGLTYAKVSGPSWLNVASNGSLSGMPLQADAELNVFLVSVSDGVNAAVEASLEIQVNAVNDAPVFTIDPIVESNGTEDAPYSGTMDGSATDEEGDVLTYAKVSGPAWLSIASNGALSGTPLNADAGLNSFMVSVADGTAPAVEVSLEITVIAVNDAPVFTVNPMMGSAANEDAPYSGTLAGSAFDEEGDNLTYAKVSGPAWLSVASSGALSGMPLNADVGLNSFTVSVSDGTAPAALATLEVTVLNVNDAPVFSADPIAGTDATEDTPYSGTIAGSASDVDIGDTLTYAKVSGPSWLSVASNGALSGMPLNADVGLNSFMVSVSDGTAPAVQATLEVTVLNVNDAPSFTVDPIVALDAASDEAYADTLSGSAEDDDADDVLTYSKVSGPAWLSVASDGSLSGTPGVSDAGTNVFVVQVADLATDADTATLNLFVDAPAGPDIRVTEYYLTTGDFSGTTAMLTLDQDLTDDYYVLIRGSRTGDGTSNPNNDYARVVSVPGGKGDLAASGANNQIGLRRQAADHDWEGVVTVVECGNADSDAGFKLVDVVETAMTSASGTDTTATWSDINQVVLFGGYRGGGVEMFGSPGNRKQGTGCYTRLYPSGGDTLNWTRDAGGETMFDATMTTFVVEWGVEWTVQHVNVAGSNGGEGADATGEYTTAAINSVARDNTWVWGTGTRADSGIGDCAESCLVTLGDGVSQNPSETSVAVGSEYTDAYSFDVYVLTHPNITVDHRFKIDGDSTGLDVAVAVDAATAGVRFGWVYNGCNGTGSAFPRPRMWARYTTDSEVTISRGYDGQNFPAWVQAIDLSGLND